MKVHGGVEPSIHVFLTSALVEDQWQILRPDRFTHWIGGWIDVENLQFLTLPGLQLRILYHPARS
jgi:hypothetical protein